MSSILECGSLKRNFVDYFFYFAALKTIIKRIRGHYRWRIIYYCCDHDFIFHVALQLIMISLFTSIHEYENFCYACYYHARIYQTVGTFNSGPIPAFLELFDEHEFNSRVNYRSGLNPFALWRN